jgi:hypothetical protein
VQNLFVRICYGIVIKPCLLILNTLHHGVVLFLNKIQLNPSFKNLQKDENKIIGQLASPFTGKCPHSLQSQQNPTTKTRRCQIDAANPSSGRKNDP